MCPLTCQLDQTRHLTSDFKKAKKLTREITTENRMSKPKSFSVSPAIMLLFVNSLRRGTLEKGTGLLDNPSFR